MWSLNPFQHLPYYLFIAGWNFTWRDCWPKIDISTNLLLTTGYLEVLVAFLLNLRVQNIGLCCKTTIWTTLVLFTVASHLETHSARHQFSERVTHRELLLHVIIFPSILILMQSKITSYKQPSVFLSLSEERETQQLQEACKHQQMCCIVKRYSGHTSYKQGICVTFLRPKETAVFFLTLGRHQVSSMETRFSSSLVVVVVVWHKHRHPAGGIVSTHETVTWIRNCNLSPCSAKCLARDFQGVLRMKMCFQRPPACLYKIVHGWLRSRSCRIFTSLHTAPPM